ncbi:hypothetical protein AN958_03680 [Leucoagaricus sp. SymC.cos]|nr:hypothetical protein AN958_03680 [Leucoagaricus sp. SymC.cos]
MNDNPYVTQWSNMVNDMTLWMWSIFEETGIFLVESSKSKYPLVLVNILLDTLPSNIVCGYDIGCKFSTTISHTALGEKAKARNFKSIVNTFHGYVHKCLCQLTFHPTYVDGIRLEDLEGCKRYFLHSNALASSTCYTTPFHHKQKIVSFIEHMDKFKTSYNLSSFLVNNYCQALEILDDEAALLEGMKNKKIGDRQIFHTWLDEEHEYLQELFSEPEEEALYMDYYQSLVNLKARIQELNIVKASWNVTAGVNPNDPQVKQEQKLYLNQCTHTQKSLDQAQAATNHFKETIPIFIP